MYGRFGFVLLLLTVLLFTSGCADPVGGQMHALVFGETVRYPDDEPPFIQVKVGNKWVEISDVDMYPSKPVISPDGQRMVYLSPNEFEMAAEVWLYESGEGKADVLLERDAFAEAETPYRLLWVNEYRLAVVSGYQYGTIPSLRLLEELDIRTGMRRTLLALPERETIRELVLEPDGNRLKLIVDMYNESYTDAEPEERWLDLQP